MTRPPNDPRHATAEIDKVTPMEGVDEYAEGYDVELIERQYRDAAQTRRVLVRAYNEGGHNCVEIDLIDLVAWLKTHRPELLT